MKNIVFPMSILTASLFFTGCGVSKKTYVGLQTEYKNLQTQYQDSQLQLTESRTRIKSLEDQLASERQNNADLKAAYAAL
ncbi:MAG: hypothetical protein ACN6PN_13335, partial [Sphingobacterium sp.]